MLSHITVTLTVLLAAAIVNAQAPNATTPSPAPCKVDSVCFAYDMSGSISTSEYNQEVDAIVKIARTVRNLSTSTSYSAHGFTSSSVLVQAPTTDLEGVFIPAVQGFSRSSGGTDLSSGLSACFSSIGSAKGNRVIVLLTDGQDLGGAIITAQGIKQAGVKIITVGIGSGVAVDYLKSIASTPAFYTQTSFNQIVADAIKITSQTCAVVDAPVTAVTPTPTPSPSPKPVDSCEAAYQACGFRFSGAISVPTIAVGKPDMALSPKIVSRMSSVRVGIVNSNGIAVEFIWPNGSAGPIANSGFPPTAFKPYTMMKMTYGSGIGHQALSPNLVQRARGRCVRVFFSEYQVLEGTQMMNVKQNLAVSRRDNKCVVFRWK